MGHLRSSRTEAPSPLSHHRTLATRHKTHGPDCLTPFNGSMSLVAQTFLSAGSRDIPVSCSQPNRPGGRLDYVLSASLESGHFSENLFIDVPPPLPVLHCPQRRKKDRPCLRF